MTLRDLEIFLEVCKLNSVTFAAEQLHISQPAVSSTIRKMESHFGQLLFERSGRSLYITPFGIEIQKQTQQLLDSYNVLLNSKTIPKKMRIGAATSIGESFLPVALREFIKHNPDADIQVFVKSTKELIQMARDNQVDFILTENDETWDGMYQIPLQRSPVVPVCGICHPLAKKEIVTLEELSKQTLLLGANIKSSTLDFFNERNLPILSRWESSSVLSLRNAAANGLGVAFISINYVITDRNDELTILNVPEFRAYRTVKLQYNRKKLLTPLMNDFISFYQDYIDGQLRKAKEAYKKCGKNLSYPDA